MAKYDAHESIAVAYNNIEITAATAIECALLPFFNNNNISNCTVAKESIPDARRHDLESYLSTRMGFQFPTD